VIANQCIVFTDLRGFTAITETSPMVTVEKLLDRPATAGP
jgi:class 3 adenylate cyclase